MAQPALHPMTVGEFLRWDGGDDRRHELIGGVPLAMAPPSASHSRICGHLARELGSALSGKDRYVSMGSGIGFPSSDEYVLVPDVLVVCGQTEGNAPLETEPQVVIEVLSPSTEAHDRRTKLPVYRAHPSVREIVFLDSRSRFAEVHRRLADGSWPVDLLQNADDAVTLPSLDISIPLGALYEGIRFESANPKSS